MSNHDQYEYRVVELSSVSAISKMRVENELTDLGKEGWRVVSVAAAGAHYSSDRCYIWTLERKVEQ